MRKRSLCRQIELIYLKCHQSKTVLGKQIWWKEIWMFPMTCTVRLCSLARLVQYPAPWQRLKASPTHGFWQKCALVGVGNNAKTPLHHLIITTALFTRRFSLKRILSHYKTSPVMCYCLCWSTEMQWTFNSQQPRENEVEACILFAVYLPASKKPKKTSLSEAYVTHKIWKLLWSIGLVQSYTV